MMIAKCTQLLGYSELYTTEKLEGGSLFSDESNSNH